MPRLAFLVIPLALTASCVDGGRREARNEASLVVSRYDAVRSARPDELASRVAQLRSVGVHDPEVRHVRDLCAEVYGAFARARSLSDEARARFDRYAALAPADRRPDEAAALERMLTEANAAALAAQRGISPCVDGVGRIRGRYDLGPH
jgi:hypothetical protein